jgi:hypothetical protein
MTKGLSYLLLIAIISCTDKASEGRRLPANLPDEYKVSRKLKIYTGPGEMQTDYFIGKSLKDINLDIKIISLPQGVTCKFNDGNYGKELNYTLGASVKGAYDSVACKLKYSGDDYPTEKTIDVEYLIKNRTAEMDISELETYENFDKLIMELKNKNLTTNLLKFIEHNFKEKTLEIDVTKGFDSSVSVYKSVVDLQNFTGEIKTFKKSLGKIESKGKVVKEKNKKKLLNPSHNAYELVCNLNSVEVKGSDFKSVFFLDYNDEISCQINKFKNDSGKKASGKFIVTYKTITHKLLDSLLRQANKEQEHYFHNHKSALWENDNKDLSRVLGRIDQEQADAYSLFTKRIKSIDRAKFEEERDKVINTLFAVENVDGTIGQGVTVYTFSPVEKKFILDNGNTESKTYIYVTNMSKALFKSKVFSFDFDYQEYAKQDMDLYLYSEDKWTGKHKKFEVKVCTNNQKTFLNALAGIANKGNAQAVSFSDYKKTLLRYHVKNLGSCTFSESNQVIMTRTEDFFWAGEIKDDEFVLREFGVDYKGQFSGANLEFTYFSNGAHPLRGQKYSVDKLKVQESDDRPYVYRTADEFVITP